MNDPKFTSIGAFFLLAMPVDAVIGEKPSEKPAQLGEKDWSKQNVEKSSTLILRISDLEKVLEDGLKLPVNSIRRQSSFVFSRKLGVSTSTSEEIIQLLRIRPRLLSHQTELSDDQLDSLLAQVDQKITILSTRTEPSGGIV